MTDFQRYMLEGQLKSNVDSCCDNKGLAVIGSLNDGYLFTADEMGLHVLLIKFLK